MESQIRRCILRCKLLLTQQFRFYAKSKAKIEAREIALNHFDQFYGSVFKNWTSIRLGLLSPHSYCAVMNTFAKTDAESLEELGAFKMREAYCCELKKQNENSQNVDTVAQSGHNLRSIPTQDLINLNLEPDTRFEVDAFVPCTTLVHRDIECESELEIHSPSVVNQVTTVKEQAILFPEHLEVYLFPRGKFVRFPPPKQDVTGLFNYYLMDGASLLPVLALDIQEGDDVGDLCASPGGKSLAIIFSLKFGKLVCNDIQHSRLSKLKTVLNSYLPHAGDWNKRVLISNIDVCSWHQFEAFDKILLDVPCTNDRLSVMKDGNNIFANKRYEERIRLPQVQCDMLCCALKALKPDGCLVYSTCTLSPLQNDGVVHMALSKLNSEPDILFHVKDLSEAFKPLRTMYQFTDKCEYGQLVIPFLPLNYGPMYICKIIRVK